MANSESDWMCCFCVGERCKGFITIGLMESIWKIGYKSTYLMEVEAILFLLNHTWRKKQQAICIKEVGACHHEFQVIIQLEHWREVKY